MRDEGKEKSALSLADHLEDRTSLAAGEYEVGREEEEVKGEKKGDKTLEF